MRIAKGALALLLMLTALLSGLTTFLLLHCVQVDSKLAFLPLVHVGLFFWAVGTLLAWGVQATFRPESLRLGASLREGFFLALWLLVAIAMRLFGIWNWLFVAVLAVLFVVIDLFFWHLASSVAATAKKGSQVTTKSNSVVGKK